MLDLLIRNGLIVDGTGRPAFRADVGVQGGYIVEVGKVSSPAKRVIDAEGLMVTPGFVDLHTHYDGQVSWDNVLAPSSINGVTTVAMGNCGVGFAPAKPDKHAWLINLLEGIEDIPGTALAEGLKWDWETFPDYLDAIERNSYTMDVAAHMPHAALRTFVMGERGANHEIHPDDNEINEMSRLTTEALQAGAIGFSTSRTFVHRTRSGENVGTLTAKDKELLSIAEGVRKAGTGVLQMISDAYMTTDDEFATTELNLVQRMAETAGSPLSLTVIQTDAAPDRWRWIFNRIANMNKAGLDVKAQIATRPIGLLAGFGSSINPFFMTPTYLSMANMPVAEKLKKLAEPDVRARILAEHKDLPTGAAMGDLHLAFHLMFRMSDPVDYEPKRENSLLGEAERKGIDPAEYAYDAMLEEGGRRLFLMPLVNFTGGTLKNIHAMMTSDHTLFGLSDGGAHCGTICDASFPTSTLSMWSRGDKEGRTIPIESLVHGYTQRNALHVGWQDRGVIAPGYLADINVINLADLQLSPPRIVQDLPAGGTRLLQTAKGYHFTIKNGMVTFENGEWSGVTPGGLIRGKRMRPASVAAD